MAEFEVSAAEFERTVRRINAELRHAETLGWATLLEGCLGCLSMFTLYLCYDGQYSRRLQRLATVIEHDNATVYEPHGLRLLNPLSNGFLQLEFRVLRRPPR